MILILNGNSEHVAHTCRENRSLQREKKAICDCSRSKQMPITDQITETAPYLRTYFWVTFKYKYHCWIRVPIISKLDPEPHQKS